MQIGFSTGCFYKFMQPASREVIELCRDLGCNTIELNIGGRRDRLKILKRITIADLKDFEFVTVHGPGNEDMINLSEKEKKEMLDIFQDFYEKINFNHLTLHAGEWMVDHSLFKNYSFPIAIENDDSKDLPAHGMVGLQEIFKDSKFKMALDLDHVYICDPTMKLARELYKNFKEKIVYYHLSSSDDINKINHVVLYKNKHNEIIKAIPDLNLPIIIESACDNKEEAGVELEYIKNNLKLINQ